MPRPLRSIAVALPLFALLAGCGGSGDASQGSVRDDVRDALLERAADPEGDFDISEEDAGIAADCVSRGMFETGELEFTPDERNDVTRAVDGDEPSQALVDKLNALLASCDLDLG